MRQVDGECAVSNESERPRRRKEGGRKMRGFGEVVGDTGARSVKKELRLTPPKEYDRRGEV